MLDPRTGFASIVLAALIIGATSPRPASAASCSSVSACVFGTNASTGPGVEGLSVKGDGVDGRTSFASTSPSTAKSGVAGIDRGTSAYNIGLFGYSAHGTGLHATSDTGVGVMAVATSKSGTALVATAQENPVVVAIVGKGGSGGVGDNGTGLYLHDSFDPNNCCPTGIVVDTAYSSIVSNTILGYAFSAGGGPEGYGMSIGTSSGDGLDISTSGPVGPGVPLFISGQDAGGFNALILAQSSGTTTFAAMGSGDLNVSGTVYASGFSMPVALSDGTHRATYPPRDAQPTAEDVGEARLVGGAAAVALDPAFAATIDSARPYYVFLTAEGDNRGLFVASKSARGFVIRESLNGRSSLAVQYRIVAQPLGARGARLAVVDTSWRVRADAHAASVAAKQAKLAAANVRNLTHLRAHAAAVERTAH